MTLNLNSQNCTPEIKVKNEFALANIKANKLDGKVSSLCRSSMV